MSGVEEPSGHHRIPSGDAAGWRERAANAAWLACGRRDPSARPSVLVRFMDMPVASQYIWRSSKALLMSEKSLRTKT
eukprot:1598229-Prorocentrum_lima.AAC.1